MGAIHLLFAHKFDVDHVEDELEEKDQVIRNNLECLLSVIDIWVVLLGPQNCESKETYCNEKHEINEADEDWLVHFFQRYFKTRVFLFITQILCLIKHGSCQGCLRIQFEDLFGRTHKIVIIEFFTRAIHVFMLLFSLDSGLNHSCRNFLLLSVGGPD